MATTNDNSNPQGGNPIPGQTRYYYKKNKQLQHQATPPPRRVFNVPPTKKDERKLFVGGLPANITGDEFAQFFETFGKLIDSVVMFDRDTGRSRGFGFVTFDDPTVCRQLLVMGNEGADPSADVMKLIGRVSMQGKMCELKTATPKANGMRRSDSHRGGNDPNKMLTQQHHQYGYGISPQFDHGALVPAPPAAVMYHGCPPGHVYFPPLPYMVPPGAYAPYYMDPQFGSMPAYGREMTLMPMMLDPAAYYPGGPAGEEHHL